MNDKSEEQSGEEMAKRNNDEVIQKTITVERRQYRKAKEMFEALGRDHPVNGEMNFSGVIRDCIEATNRLYWTGSLEREDVFNE